MIRFSIITVCRNEEQNIRRTCESICGQTCSDFEWIVIDGQSTDGTLALLSEYADRIGYLVSEPDDGIYDAMNKGIRQAQGEYLLFLNAGDYFADEGVLEAVASAPSCDVFYGDLRCETPDGEAFVKTFPDLLPRRFLLRNMLPHQATFFRRGLFETYGGYDTSYRIAGDYELFTRLLYHHHVSSCHLPRVLAVFGIDGISSDARQRALRKEENHRVRKKYFLWYRYSLKGVKAELKLRVARRRRTLYGGAGEG